MIYIQSNLERTLPHHFDCSCALYGSIESCKDYRLTTYEEVSSGKFDLLIKRNLFVGSVEFMREVYSRIGRTDIRLPINSNRESEISTLLEVKKRISNGEKLFIKPIEIKLFTGFVLDQMQYTCLKNLSDDTKVMVYKPFESEIKTEWRIYIHNNKMVDSRNYSGDFTYSPNYEYVNNILKVNKSTFPCAYTIDIAVLENNENVVVEFNDMWAIGNYGIPNDLYLKLLSDRYFEIVK